MKSTETVYSTPTSKTMEPHCVISLAMSRFSRIEVYIWKHFIFSFFSIHEISFIIFIIFCCYSITVVSIFRPLPSSTHPSPCSHSQSPHCCPCPWAIPTCSLSSPSPSFHHFPPFPFPSGHCQSVPCFRACGSIVLVSLFCSLDSSYRWDHTVFVFHRLSFCFGKSYSS